MDEPPDDEGSPRAVEYYATVVELSAAIVLRGSAGWHVLSAGFVCADMLWVEYEQADAQ